jgi:hypothetical protein
MTYCIECHENKVEPQRVHHGFKRCLACATANPEKPKTRTVVPMPKSNYIMVTDMSLLHGLNSSHKGGVR